MAKRPTKEQLRVRQARKLDKKKPGFGSYTYRLSVVRKLTSAFDAKKYDALKFTRPRTERAKVAKRRALNNFNRVFHRARGFLTQPHKMLAPKNKKHFETLRQYAHVPLFKKMRAVPFLTSSKKVRVYFDREGRPTINEGGLRHKLFLFPRRPKAHKVREKDGTKRFVDIQEDAQNMLRAMLPSMPEGFYALMTNQQFIISEVGDRESLLDDLALFYDKYAEPDDQGRGGKNFTQRIIGFKYLTNSIDAWQQWKDELRSKRAREKGARTRQRLAKALKEIIAMDKQLKSGKPLSRGQQTRRAKLTKRGRATGRR